MGGLSWFAIPWLCATTMGLAALALESNPVFPTFPMRMDPNDVSAGLVLPYAAVALLGKGGAVATLLLIFMAVTSAMSAELIAVSSIFTYDIYKTYVNPKASGSRLIGVSHSVVVLYAIIMAGFSTGLYYIGISMGYLYLFMGVLISSAVLPASLTLLWSQQSWAAATFSPILGLACSLAGWLATAKHESGGLSVDSTGANNPMLVGNIVALLSPLVFVPILTYALRSPKYDWQSMKQIRKADDEKVSSGDVEITPMADSASTSSSDEQDQIQLLKSAKIARWLTVVLTLALLVLWPMPMYGTGYVFSERFFTGWVVVGILWLFVSAACVGIYPLWEGRKTSARTFKLMALDLCGKWKPAPARYTDARETASSEEVQEEVRMKEKM